MPIRIQFLDQIVAALVKDNFVIRKYRIEAGTAIDEMRSGSIESSREFFTLWPTSMAHFIPGGKVAQPGEIFRQPDLARTLRGMVAALTAQAALSGWHGGRRPQGPHRATHDLRCRAGDEHRPRLNKRGPRLIGRRPPPR